MQLARQACSAAVRGKLLLPPCWADTAALPTFPKMRSLSQTSKQNEEHEQNEQDDKMPAAMRKMLDAFDAAPVPGSEQSSAAALPRRAGARQPFLSAAARRQAESDKAAAEAAAAAAAAASTQPTNAFQVLELAVENCKPLMKLIEVKKGTKPVQVPVVITPAEQRSLSLRWIIEAARKRKQGAKLKTTTMADCLATELLLAAQRKGAAREKRDAVHKVAIENRSFLSVRA